MKKLFFLALAICFITTLTIGSIAMAGDDGKPAANPIYMGPQTGTLQVENTKSADITIFRTYPRLQLPSSIDIVGGVAPNTTVTFSDLPPGTYEVRTGDKNAKTFEIIAGKTAIIGT